MTLEDHLSILYKKNFELAKKEFEHENYQGTRCREVYHAYAMEWTLEDAEKLISDFLEKKFQDIY